MKRFVIQGAPKLVTQRSAVITSEIEVTIWSGALQNLRLVLKFPFRPPDSIPLMQSCETAYCLYRKLVAWIGRGGTIAWSTWSPDLTLLDFLTFICLRATLSYDVAHRIVRSWRQNSFGCFLRWPWNTLRNRMCGVACCRKEWGKRDDNKRYTMRRGLWGGV
jgi:hypothetical protein